MKFIPILCVLTLIGCADRTSSEEYRYCIHNGYSAWNPCCKEMRRYTIGVVLKDCVSYGGKHEPDIYNPTNVTDESEK